MIRSARTARPAVRLCSRAIAVAVLAAGLILGVFAATSEAQPVRYISTIAGSGIQGALGDGGQATEAQLRYPWGLTMDSGGNLFIADSHNHKIRRVDATTGVITTVAGTGNLGYSGDGGVATDADLIYPYTVAVDGDGNIYFNDYVNSVVRKVAAATGIISVYAGTVGESGYDGDGGQATAAKLASPYGVAVDAGGNLFIADSNNSRIRRVDAATGVITTFAGTGVATSSGDGGPSTDAALYFPQGITCDTLGNLYFTDYQSSIRRVDAATGIISTVAGVWGEFTSAGDGGLATDATFEIVTGIGVDGAGNLYIPDNQGYRLRFVEAATGIISTIAGTGVYGFAGDGGLATAAQFGHLPGIAVDAAGNVWVADQDNHRVRLVSTTLAPVIPDNPADKTVTVGGTAEWALAASGIPMPSLQWQVSTDGGANFADLADGAPYSGVTTGTLTITPASFSLNGYQYRLVAVNSAGRAETAAATLTVARLVPVVSWTAPSAILPGTALDDAQLNATASVPGTFAYDPPAGTVLSVGTEQVLRTTFTPTDLLTYEVVSKAVLIDVIGPNGEGARYISTVAGTGAGGFSGDGGPATAAEINRAYGVAVGGSGNLLIGDVSNHRVRMVMAATGIISTVAGNGVAGNSGDGGPATAAQLDGTVGVALDGAGNLYIADHLSHVVRRVDAATGLISTVAGTGVAGESGDGGLATAAQLRAPLSVIIDQFANLIISDSDNSRIRKVNAATGIITTIAGGNGAGYSGDGGPATAAKMEYIFSLALDGPGNLYLADYRNHCIRKIDAVTGIISTVAGGNGAGFSGDGGPATSAQLNFPLGVAVDTDGNLYISDTNNCRIRKVTASAGLISTIAGVNGCGFAGDGGLAIDAWLNSPYNLAIDGRALYVADGNNNRIRKIAEGAAPAIVGHPSDATVVAGGTVTFTASVAGHPGPALQWQVSGNGIDFDDLAEGGAYSGVTTQVLRITGAAEGQTGLHYRAVATNGFGQATSDAATLTVTPAGPVNGPPYTLTITPPTGGRIQGAGLNCGAGPTTCSVTMPAAMTLGLGATASAGYTFTAWTGDCSGTAPAQWVSLNGPRTCGAVFTPTGGTPAYQLTIQAPTGGSVSGAGLSCGAGGASCQVTFGVATTANLTATPSVGYTFAGWGGACAGVNPSTSVLVNAALTCTATFAAAGGGPINGPPYTLSVALPTGGNVQGAGINCGAGGTTCSVSMPAAMTIGLSATASAGYTFTNWTGDCAGTTTSQWVSLQGPRTCGAVFTPVGGVTYRLVITPVPAGGTVTSDGLTCGTGGAACAVTFGGATTATLTATPDADYVFSRWGGACSGTNPGTSVLVDAVKACSATFTKAGAPVDGPPYTLTVTPPTGGNVQGAGINCGAGGTACSVTMPASMTLGLSATPSAGFAFSGWTGDCSGANPGLWVALNGPRTCGATFTAVR